MTARRPIERTIRERNRVGSVATGSSRTQRELTLVIFGIETTPFNKIGATKRMTSVTMRDYVVPGPSSTVLAPEAANRQQY